MALRQTKKEHLGHDGVAEDQGLRKWSVGELWLKNPRVGGRGDRAQQSLSGWPMGQWTEDSAH